MEGQAVLGFVLIAIGLARTDPTMAFPGWFALLPVSGALLLIDAGPRASVNRVVLSSRPLVWFGLISFPLYLWHWWSGFIRSISCAS